MDNTQVLKQLEHSIQVAKADIEFGQAIERLRNNKDFKKVVVEGLFKEEAIRLVHLKGDPGMQSPEQQEMILKQMDVISGFSSFLDTAMHCARMAAKSVEADEATRDELLAEELE